MIACQERFEETRDSCGFGGRLYRTCLVSMIIGAMIIGMFPMALGPGEEENKMPARARGNWGIDLRD